MFELLAPVFAVAGGLLAGVPIILHMFRRTPAVRMPFSIVRFLTPSLPKTTRRSTLEHWPLMLLRILAVALIALAFARPFQRLTVAKAGESGSADRFAVLIDASASMRRDGIREAVLAEIQKIGADLHDEDTLSIATFSASVKSLVTAAEWRQTEIDNRAALIERAMTAYEPDWMSTHTANAMLEAADEVAREEGATGPNGDRKVILITDFQQGSELDELRSGTWPDSVKLDLRVVQPTIPGNAGLSLVEDNRSGRIRVRVTNSGDAPTTKYTLRTFDLQGAFVGTPLDVVVGGGQRRTFSMPDAVEGQPQIVGVELFGEPHAFDNVVDLPIDDRGVVQVAHTGSVDANNADTMRYYLQRALDGNDTDPVELIDLTGSDGVVIPPPEKVRLVFVTEPIQDGLVGPLNEFADRGGMVVIALKSQEMAASVIKLLPENTAIEEAEVKDYAMLGQIDFTDSLLSPFADARFADFSSIRFWHYRKLTFDEKLPTAARVLARFDSGAPAILQANRPSGGKVIVLTSGWHPEDSQWALSTRFPAMINRLVRMANPRRSGHQLCEVGERIYPQEISGTEKWTLTLPDGSSRTADSATVAAVVADNSKPSGGDDMKVVPNETSESDSAPLSSVTLDVPGRWTLTAESDEGPKSISLLVTVAASESRTEPLPVGQLQALGLSPDVAEVKDPANTTVDPAIAAQMDANELESRQKFWRWMLLAGLACLAFEAIVAALIERKQSIEVA